MADHTRRYNLALLGDFREATSNAIRGEIATRIKELGLKPGTDVSLYQSSPQGFNPSIDRCCAALCSQIAPTDEAMIEHLITRRVPLIQSRGAAAKLPPDYRKHDELLNYVSLFATSLEISLITKES